MTRILALLMWLNFPILSLAGEIPIRQVGSNAFNGTLAYETALAYDNSYTYDLASQSIEKISAIVRYASATISAVTFSSGTYSIGGSEITMAAHRLTDGLGVTFTEGSGTAPLPLVDTSVYYVKMVDENIITLSTTQAQALAGDYIVFTSSEVGNDETYTLTPEVTAGTPGLTWQMSDNGSDFLSVSITSITIASYTNPYAEVAFDFKDFNYRYLRLNVDGPTAGGIILKANLYLKR